MPNGELNSELQNRARAWIRRCVAPPPRPIAGTCADFALVADAQPATGSMAPGEEKACDPNSVLPGASHYRFGDNYWRERKSWRSHPPLREIAR